MISVNMQCPICASDLKGVIEDLAVQEVIPENISLFVHEKFHKYFDVEDIKAHCDFHFNVEDRRKLKIALTREKIRQSDELYEEGQQRMINTVQTMNHLLDQVLTRYKLLLTEQEADPRRIKERDLVGYIQQIRETTKLLHELNREVKNEDYIPRKVFQEESARLLQFVADVLSRFDRKIPGHNLKDEFLAIAMKEYKSQLPFAPSQAYISVQPKPSEEIDIDLDNI